jgi:protein-S-isoprenylcysteine O-methyltransferase Ste14
MYLSMIVILLGVGVLLGSVQALLPAAVLGPVLHYRFIRKEESMLMAEFGEGYESFCAQVGRWL